MPRTPRTEPGGRLREFIVMQPKRVDRRIATCLWCVAQRDVSVSVCLSVLSISCRYVVTVHVSPSLWNGWWILESLLGVVKFGCCPGPSEGVSKVSGLSRQRNISIPFILLVEKQHKGLWQQYSLDWLTK